MAGAECPNIHRCELFPKIKLRSSLNFCVETYCRGDFSRCSRYQHMQSTGTKPPSDLLPNGQRLSNSDE